MPGLRGRKDGARRIALPSGGKHGPRARFRVGPKNQPKKCGDWRLPAAQGSAQQRNPISLLRVERALATDLGVAAEPELHKRVGEVPVSKSR